MLARRGLPLVLAALLAQPTAALAARAPDPAALAGQAQRELQSARETTTRDPRLAARRYAHAAALYGKAAAALPEVAEHRDARAGLLDQAGSAYIEAYRLTPDDRAPLHAAKALARAHLDAFLASYGPVASVLEQYTQAKALAREVDTLLGQTPAPAAPPKRARVDWRRVGLGTSIALAGVSVGAAIGTGFAVSRSPVTGSVYKDIVTAAEANGVPTGPGDDMCASGRDMAVNSVIAACDTRDRVWNASVAMMVVSGVMVASAITFGALLARSRRGGRTGVAIAPAPGGAFLAAAARF